MKKTTLLLFLLMHSVLLAQFNEMAPWFSEQDAQGKVPVGLDAHIKSFETYWRNRDPQKKGSGFKPFKRWEHHWKYYQDKHGGLATPSFFWQAWEQEKMIARDELSNWRSLGPYTTNVKYGQGRINTFHLDPNDSRTFYVGAPSGGIWRSEDSGQSWIPLSDEIPQIGVSGIAIDPNNPNVIYIATGDDDSRDTYSVGVLKSTDRGATWNKTGLDFSATNSVSSEIYMHPQDPNTLWVATNKGLYKTKDGGANWQLKIAINILDIKLKPGDPDVIYAVSPSKFYKSTNGGESFELTKEGLPATSGRFAIDVSPADPSVVYLLSANLDNSFQGVYRSNDSGDSFKKTQEAKDIFGGSTQAWYDMALTVNPEDADMVFVGVLDIWRSTNGGENFQQMNYWWDPGSPSYTHADIHFMRYFNGALYAGTDGGIYASDDNAQTFTDLTEGLNISQYYRISTARRNPELIVGGLQDNGGFAYANKGWYQYHGGDGMDCLVDPNNENTFYGFSQFGGNLNVTYNAGMTEGGVVARAPVAETDGGNDPGGNWITPLAADEEGNIYAGYSKFYKLVNNKWEPVSDASFGGDLNEIAISSSHPEVILVSRVNKLFKSTDRGKNFSELNFNFPALITSLDINNQDERSFYVSTGGVDGKVYKSEDGGANWKDITLNLPDDAKLVIRHQDQSPENDLYLGTSVGVYHINDQMSQWERFDNGLPNVPVMDMEINVEDGLITAGTYGRGVWQSPISVQKAANDLVLLEVNSNNTVQCNELSPLITVKNNGLQSLDKINVDYYIDGVKYSSVLDITIEPDETKVLELPNVSSLELGDHEIRVETRVANDAFPSNNTLKATFQLNSLGEGTYVHTFGDVEEDNWITYTLGSDIPLWEKGVTSTKNFKDKFDNAYTTNLSGNYTDNSINYLLSPCYDLSTILNPVLKFDMVFNIEKDWDVLYMEYSLDNGFGWEILGTAEDPNWYNSSFKDPQRPLTTGKQWTGTDLVPKTYSYNLAELADETSVVFRFVFGTDQSVNEEGAVIDNFTIDGSVILAVEEFDRTNYQLYPNPSSDVFFISRKQAELMDIQLFDLTGRLIKEIESIEERTYGLDLSDVKTGVYFLKIREGSRVMATRLLKR